MGKSKSNITMKTVEIDMEDISCEEDLREALLEAGLPESAADEFLMDIPSELRREMLANKVDQQRKDFGHEKDEDGESDSTSGVNSSEIVDVLMEVFGNEKAAKRSKHNTKKKIETVIKDLEGMVGKKMPDNMKYQIMGRFKDEKKVSLTQVIKHLSVGIPPELKELASILHDLREKTSQLEGKASKVQSIKDDEKRLVVEDMVVRRKGTQKFFKVVKATTRGRVDLVPVDDVVADPKSLDALRYEPDEFHKFLRSYSCVWDPREDENFDGADPLTQH